ncbi:hypothetical protein ACWOFR_07390 [Carnobacterium gallinarum]|uniref:hypothetical protein n=1 Tax=Carnobacterium gallinarum TaxID=2749 RepID=UPI000555DD4D|nr:hypothetical protein [Carnobacterium gallinarum]
MKKMTKVLSLVIVATGMLFVNGGNASAEYWSGYPNRDETPYAYIPNADVRDVLSHIAKVNKSELYENYGLIEKEKLAEITGDVSLEMETYSLDGFQYAVNSTSFDSEATFAVDYRPLENLTKVEKFREYSGPMYSIDFLKNMTNLKDVYIRISARTDYESEYGSIDKALRPIVDLSTVDNLENLTYFNIIEEPREAQAISMKKSMTQYQLVDPIILSKQFEDAAVEYSSSDTNFTIEDGVMTWNNLDPSVTELHYSWDASHDNEKIDGTFKFSGETIIPLNWK